MVAKPGRTCDVRISFNVHCRYRIYTHKSLQIQMIGLFRICGGLFEFFLAGTSCIKWHKLRMKPCESRGINARHIRLQSVADAYHIATRGTVNLVNDHTSRFAL